MKSFQTDFQDRVIEIEKFFSFAESIDTNEHNAEYSNGIKLLIDDDLRKILRSTCFLLLYNLIESSIRNGIVEIYDSIHSDKLSYIDVKERIQAVWINNRTNNLLSDSIGKKAINDSVKKILTEVLDKIDLFLEKEKLPISGNLDAEKIAELTNHYGFHGKISKPKGSKFTVEGVMETIKKSRNDLAHGNQSFRSLAKATSMPDLLEYKKITINYLSDILNNIESYIDHKKYKK